MRTFILVAFLAVFSQLSFSQKLMTRAGEIKFEATMPAFEEIAAKSNSVSCILDANSGEIAVLVLVKSFRFKSPLMEEHFNENYLESGQYPKATFKGKVLNFSKAKLSSTKTIFDVEGELTMHGVTNKVKTKISMSQAADNINVISSFKIKLADYKIAVPSLVRNKVSESVTIDLKFDLEKKS